MKPRQVRKDNNPHIFSSRSSSNSSIRFNRWNFIILRTNLLSRKIKRNGQREGHCKWLYLAAYTKLKHKVTNRRNKKEKKEKRRKNQFFSQRRKSKKSKRKKRRKRTESRKNKTRKQTESNNKRLIIEGN